MLDKTKRIELTELMQDQFQDLSIIKDKPFVFENERGLILIVKPVLYIEHDRFLKDMASLILKNYSIFGTLEFLDSSNYSSEEALNKIVSKVSIFTASSLYSTFKKDSIKFLYKWTYVTKKRKTITYKRNKRLCKKFLYSIDPSEFIHILFLVFVRNFDIVKKNLMELMKSLHITLKKNSNTLMDISSPGISREAVVMPKYSEKPYPESILNSLERQSKM